MTTFPLAIIGLGVSIYLTIEHLSSSMTFACPESSTINCVKVTTSSYSKLHGIPVVYLGLAFFIGAIVLFSPWAWKLTAPLVRAVRLGSVMIGLVMVGYLVWAELYKIHAICLYCTSVHVITLLMFIVILFAEVGGPQAPADLAWLDDDGEDLDED